jgi:predicted transcriptional regulator
VAGTDFLQKPAKNLLGCYYGDTFLKDVMPATTSLKLPDGLKNTIAKVAAFEGKTAHALMVDTLQSAMADALERQQFYVDGEASYQDTLRTNSVYSGADVKAYVLARLTGGEPGRPPAQPLDTAKPMNQANV